MTLTVSPFGIAPTPATASRVPSAHASASAQATGASGWHIEERPGSGRFIVSDAGTLLFRIEPERGLVFPYCKKTGREVAVSMTLLQSMAF